MKNVRTAYLIVAVLVLLSALLMNAQDSKAGNAGNAATLSESPSFEETTAWMVSKLQHITLSYSQVGSDSKVRSESRRIYLAHAGQCVLDVRSVERFAVNDSPPQTSSDTFKLEFAKIDPNTINLKDINSGNGQLANISHYEPEIWVLSFGYKDGGKITITEAPYDLDSNRTIAPGETRDEYAAGIWFPEKQLATRFSRALVHAVSLCGGLKEEPF
jgi:hypothetical protein